MQIYRMNKTSKSQKKPMKNQLAQINVECYRTKATPTETKQSKIVVRRDMTPDYEREIERDALRTETGKAHKDVDGSPHESPDTISRQAETTARPWIVETRQDIKYPDITLAQVVAPVGYVDRDGKTHRCAVTDWLDSPADAALIVASVNHADKLAGALRNALNMIDPFVWDKSKEAAILDAYEKELQ